MLDYGFNVYNSYTLEYFNQYYVTLSPELTMMDIEKMNITNNAIFVCYGKLRLMTMKHCLVTGKQHCNNCGLCDKKVELKDTFGNIYPVKSDKKLNYIYNCKNKNYIDLIDKLKKANVKNFRIDLLDENKEETLKVVKAFLLSINN
jgi:putative protease